MTENQIKQILSGLPGVRVNRVATLWQISVGGLSGARENGIALAQDLKTQYEYRKAREAPMPSPAEAYTVEPEPVEIPAFLKEVPDPRLDLQAARIAELEAALAAAAAPKPEPAMANPPAEASDVIDWTAPPKDRQEALLVKLREVIGLIGLAEDRGGRADASLYRKRDAIESGIRYNRATLAETI